MIITTTTSSTPLSLVRSLLLLSVIVAIPSLIHCQHLRTTVIRKYPFSEKCTEEDRKSIIKCEDDAGRQWSVDDSTYYTSSRKFCCFVYETLSCAVEVATRCDQQYASELKRVTEETLRSLCDYTSGSSSCAFPAWSWWPLVPIVLGCIAICCLVLFFAYPSQSGNSSQQRRFRTKSTLSHQAAYTDVAVAESAI